jgi:hypothetical protein
MAPRVTTARAERLVAELAKLPADERAEVLDAARALPARAPARTADEMHDDLVALAAEVDDDDSPETFSVDEVVRDLRAEFDL